MELFGITIGRRESEGSPDATPSTPQGNPHGGDVQGVVTRANGEHSSLTVPAFFRAVNLRCDTISRLAMQYQKWYSGCYTIDNGPTRGHHMNYLLQKEPNPYVSATTFWRSVEFRRFIRGNAFIYVERGLDEEVKAFWLCWSGLYDTYRDEYTIVYPMGTVPVTKSVPSRDIIHLRGPFLDESGFYGVPVLVYASRALNLSATQDQQTLDTMSKGGRHKLILQEQAQQNMGFGKVQRKEMEKLQSRVQNDLPAFDVLYIPNIASVNNITQTLSELEMSTMRKLSVADISRFTAVPRTLLGDDTNTTYKTPEAANLDFLNNGIAPQIEEIEDEFDRKLLGEAGFGQHRFHFCADKLFRLDRQSQGLWNKNRLETGVVSVNELRAEAEMAPIPGGDAHLVSANLVELGSPKLSGKTDESGKDTDPQPDDGKKKGGKS